MVALCPLGGPRAGGAVALCPLLGAFGWQGRSVFALPWAGVLGEGWPLVVLRSSDARLAWERSVRSKGCPVEEQHPALGEERVLLRAGWSFLVALRGGSLGRGGGRIAWQEDPCGRGGW
ncbi:hypothetical protein GCM10010412_063180 [Nonomuraea recticatena]|uniref:Secreted protein n=1 Tax=Nonomuraea recticatena TaxID=46178 RepID=A0ABN3SK88_9ACTN